VLRLTGVGAKVKDQGQVFRKKPTGIRKMQGIHLAQLLSVNVGQPREITWRGKTVYTSVWKEPVQLRTNRR